MDHNNGRCSYSNKFRLEYRRMLGVRRRRSSSIRLRWAMTVCYVTLLVASFVTKAIRADGEFVRQKEEQRNLGGPNGGGAVLSLEQIIEGSLGTPRTSNSGLDTDLRIVGGTAAPLGKFPFYVNTLEPILCGGTLVHEDVILTAAHCGGGFLAGVSIGGVSINGGDGAFLDVDSELPHPDYDTVTRINDIMLVKLSNPSSVTPVSMNFDTAVPAVGDVLTVTGYGDTSDGGVTSPILLEVDVDAYDDDFCDRLYAVYEPDTMLCAGTEAGGRDSCQGDSGGPLFTTANVQVGVVSTGSGCGEPDIPAIYSEVSAYETWIRAGICSLSATPPASCTTSAPTSPPTATPATTSPPTATPVTRVPTRAPTRAPTSAPNASPTTTSSPVSKSPVTATPTTIALDGTGSPTTRPPQVAPAPAPAFEPTGRPSYVSPTFTSAPSSSPQPTVEYKKMKQMRKGDKNSEKTKSSSKKSSSPKKMNMMNMMKGKEKGKKADKRISNIYVRHPWSKFGIGD